MNTPLVNKLSNNTQRFWIVFCIQVSMPQYPVIHETKEDALRESVRLAENNQYRDFYVMEAIVKSKKIEVATINLDK